MTVQNIDVYCLWIGMSESLRMNGHISPDSTLPRSHGATSYTGGGMEDAPPPVPVKKRHQ